MKKGLVIISIIALILFLPMIKTTFDKLMIPDKVLFVGHQIDDNVIDFSKQIKDKEKINEFENIFKEVKFSQGKLDKKTAYPDMITHIRHKEGIATHWFEIWINKEEGVTVISMSEEKLIGRLTRSQVDILKKLLMNN